MAVSPAGRCSHAISAVWAGKAFLSLYSTGSVELHDGSHLRIRKIGREYDPHDKIAAMTLLDQAETKGEVLTGLLYVNTGKPTFLEMLYMVEEPLATLPESATRPSRAALDQMMEEMR